MFSNRLPSELQAYPLPRAQEPAPSSNAFMLFPVQGWQATNPQQVQQQIYHIAWENARAMTRPSLPERDLLAVWN
jgi:hypothetical protein